MAYDGPPVCVWSSDVNLLRKAEEWFSNEYDLGASNVSSNTTNFVLFPEDGWDEQVTQGNEQLAEDAEGWLTSSDPFIAGGYKSYIFINLDEELSNESD